jgi:hypothetical protein
MEKTQNQNINKIMMAENVKQSLDFEELEKKIKSIRKEIGTYPNYKYGIVSATGKMYIEDESGEYKEIDINEFIKEWSEYLKKEGFTKFFFVVDSRTIDIWVLIEGSGILSIIDNGKNYAVKTITIFEYYENEDPRFYIYYPPKKDQSQSQ